MRIALVNQPFDVITPPFQNSIGYCTYGVGRALAKDCEVLVYGSARSHPPSAARDCDPSLQLRLMPSRPLDDAAFRARRKLGELIPLSAPVSSSGILFAHYARTVAEDLREQRPDLIHLQHCSQLAPVIRALNPQTPIVLQAHAEWFSQCNYPRLRERLRSIDLLLTVSDAIARKTVRDFPELAGRCETVYNGIDPEEFGREKDYAGRRGKRRKRLLFAGAVSPHKGPHVLLQAFNIVVEQYPEVDLELTGTLRNYPLEETFDLQDREQIARVGRFYRRRPLASLLAMAGRRSNREGAYQSYLRSILSPQAAARVVFAGFVPREVFVDAYYEADVFVFPPIWEEGFGIPPIEAMAAGTPVIGTRSGALPETIRDGETGFLVEKNDPEALAERILRLLQDEALLERMGQAARRDALQRFTWQRASRRIESLYRGLVCEPVLAGA